jgi:hypothetical protein
MTRTVRRLSLAALASAGGFAATFAWDHATTARASAGASGQPIAFVVAGTEEIERKPAARLVWESVKNGETLFTLDTVRSENHPTKLKMIDSGAVIELAPHSVIVMTKNQGKVSLDLLDGGVLLKRSGSGGGKGGATSNLELKVGGTKLATGNKPFEMSIRKQPNGKAAVAVVKGTAVATTGGGKAVAVEAGKAGNLSVAGLSTSDVLQIIAPSPGAVVDIGTGSSPVSLRWKGIDRAYAVHAEVSDGGAWRQVGGVAAGDAGALAVPLAAGPHQWRLAATQAGTGKTMTSLEYALTAISVQPPELTAPPPGA